MPNGESHVGHMQKLTYLVNDIKINLQDGFRQKAKESLKNLSTDMDYLGDTCSNCHKGPVTEYPNEKTKNSITQLFSLID